MPALRRHLIPPALNFTGLPHSLLSAATSALLAPQEWEKWLAQGGGRSVKGGQQQQQQRGQQQPGASLLPPHPARPACAPKLDAAALAQLARKDYMADL